MKKILMFVLVIIVVYVSVVLVDYIYAFKLAKKPVFTIETSTYPIVDCIESKHKGLGYNYFIRECNKQEDSHYEIKYIKFNAFEHDLRQKFYNINV